MTHRLLIIRKEKLTVAQLDELKENDHVPQIRDVMDFLVLVATEEFKTDIEFIDIQQIFDVVVDARVKLQEISPEDEAAFLQKAREHNGSVIQFNKD